MKVIQSLAAASILIYPACSFAPALQSRTYYQVTANSRLFVASEQEAVDKTEQATDIEMTDSTESEADLLARIGVSQEEMALGVSEADFLKYVGT